MNEHQITGAIMRGGVAAGDGLEGLARLLLERGEGDRKPELIRLPGGDGRTYLVSTGREDATGLLDQLWVAPPPPSAPAFADLPSLCRHLETVRTDRGQSDGVPVVYVDRQHVVGWDDHLLREDSFMMPLTHTSWARRVAELVTWRDYDTNGLDLLQDLLVDLDVGPTTRAKLARVTLNGTSASSGDVSKRGAGSVSREAMAEVAGAADIPETIELSGPLWLEHGAAMRLTLHVRLRPLRGTIGVRILQDQLDAQCIQARQELRAALHSLLNGDGPAEAASVPIPVLLGSRS